MLAVTTTHTCPLCFLKFSDKTEAEACLQSHVDVFRAQCPEYKLGDMVEEHRGGNPRYRKEEMTIVKIKGEFVELSLLVESKDGERHWLKPVYAEVLNGSHSYNFVPILRAKP